MSLIRVVHFLRHLEFSLILNINNQYDFNIFVLKFIVKTIFLYMKTYSIHATTDVLSIQSSYMNDENSLQQKITFTDKIKNLSPNDAFWRENGLSSPNYFLNFK